jgi:hypothetical protein
MAVDSCHQPGEQEGTDQMSTYHVDAHFCVDRDPRGVREMQRAIEAGILRPELRWLLEAALERKQAAGRPAWAVFTTHPISLQEAAMSATIEQPATTTSPASASAVVAALERAWAAIRARWPEIPDAVVILGVGSETRGQLKWGHFAAGRWAVAGAEVPEVLISGEGLERGARPTLCTLMHEAAHGLAHARGISDTSRQGRYHNRRYAALAEELGLEVVSDKQRGHAGTSMPDATAAQWETELADLEAALRLWRRPEAHGTAAKSRNFLALSCPCGRKVRAARQTVDEAPIICGSCEEPFEPTDTDA